MLLQRHEHLDASSRRPSNRYRHRLRPWHQARLPLSGRQTRLPQLVSPQLRANLKKRMDTSEAVPEQGRQKLAELRLILLDLHKALLDSERTAYEISHGSVGSPSAFLHLLINDPSFQWLRPITTLIVQIDETLAAKKPPASERDIAQLTADLRALLSPSREEADFWKRYFAVVQRDPAVAQLHEKMETSFSAS
jgi:hypothetical protein